MSCARARGQIAAESGVTRPTIYRHLAKLPAWTTIP